MARRIDTLLIANRAEIASRVIRAAAEMGIRTVAVFSDADEGMPYVRDADLAVRLPGRDPAATYLRGDRMIEIAVAHGADAVHPGYGFLSENAAFARQCGEAGLTFVGPPADAIERMGSKIDAKELMAAAGVPVLPGATVTDSMAVADLLEQAEAIGFPLIVKASFGGGGRGMRVVEQPGAVAEAVAVAQREARNAFGDGTVFLEEYVVAPRHVEVQVVADEHGNVAALFERECSIQRRHQKIIEEAPSPALDDELRAEMCAAAVAAARAVGYVNAGTVEFVLGDDRRFGFLEMNTRIQVEHPVTEMITGIDLVALQLGIARGDVLPTDVMNADVHGHAIEARLYAEDVAAGFLPASGRIARMRFPDHSWLRVDAGYDSGTTVSTYYDAMLAKVIAVAPTRAEAAQRLASALMATTVHGVVTNRDLLVGILRHPDFVAAKIDTAFLERFDPVDLANRGAHRDATRVHAIAVALADQEEQRRTSPIPRGIPRGWRNVGPVEQALVLDEQGAQLHVALQPGRDELRVDVNGDAEAVTVIGLAADDVCIELDGVRHRMAVHRVGADVFVDSALGSSTFRVVDRFPLPAAPEASGSLRAPMPGAIVQIARQPGDHVVAGDALVTLEAMKMEHAIRAPYDGTVAEVRVALGAQVETGAVLVVLRPDSDESPD